jgi:hypothetical protein
MPREEVTRTGKVSLEVGNRVYMVEFDVLAGGVVRLQTGQSGRLNGLKVKQVAERCSEQRLGQGRPRIWVGQRLDRV